MRVRTEAEVLHSLTGVLGTAEEQGVGTGGGTEGKLVQSKDLATGLLNASASSGGDTQSSERQLGDGQKAVIISNGSDHNDGLALVGLVDVRGNTRNRNRGAVDARHEEAAENSLVEVGLRAACQRSLISIYFFRFRIYSPPICAISNEIEGEGLIRARKRYSFTSTCK